MSSMMPLMMMLLVGGGVYLAWKNGMFEGMGGAPADAALEGDVSAEAMVDDDAAAEGEGDGSGKSCAERKGKKCNGGTSGCSGNLSGNKNPDTGKCKCKCDKSKTQKCKEKGSHLCWSEGLKKCVRCGSTAKSASDMRAISCKASGKCVRNGKCVHCTGGTGKQNCPKGKCWSSGAKACLNCGSTSKPASQTKMCYSAGLKKNVPCGSTSLARDDGADWDVSYLAADRLDFTPSLSYDY